MIPLDHSGELAAEGIALGIQGAVAVAGDDAGFNGGGGGDAAFCH